MASLAPVPPAPREMRKPEFPAVVHTYTDVLRLLRDQPQGDAGHLARLTSRDGSNVRRDMHKLIDAGVVQHDGACWLLTDKGRQWVAGQDVAEGLISPDGSVVPVTRWPIDQIRPNPANRPIDPESIPDLALSIIGADDVLQPLILTPPDANDVRMILAGERRWRAVRHIVETGSALPAALTPGVPFVEREATEAEALQITIIENSQRQDLSPWEDAQLLLQLQAATGWNASELARNIGRAAEGERSGLRDVQTKLKVAREASPAAIAAYLANGSWDQLRSSVSQPKATTLSDQVAEYGASVMAKTPERSDPDQPEMFDDPMSSTWEVRQRARIWAACDALKHRELLALVETADKILRSPGPGHGRRTLCALRRADRFSQHLIENVGYGFQSGGGEPEQVKVSEAAWEWLARRGYLSADGVDPTRLGLLRQEALGIGAEAKLRQSGRYWAEWLNLDPATQETATPAPTGPHVVNGIDYGNATRANEARYAAGILQRPSANYGSASRRDSPAPAAEPGDADTPPPAPASSAREELAEQRLERLGAALQVLTERLEPLLAALRGDRTDDGLVTLETDDAEYYEHEISEACQWAEDALAETSTVFDGWGEEIGRADIGAPAVPIRQSITADHIVCLEDGRKFKSLKRHLRTRYNLSPEEYRRRWGLPADYPMVAPNYAKAREDLVRQMGLRQAGTR